MKEGVGVERDYWGFNSHNVSKKGGGGGGAGAGRLRH